MTDIDLQAYPSTGTAFERMSQRLFICVLSGVLLATAPPPFHTILMDAAGPADFRDIAASAGLTAKTIIGGDRTKQWFLRSTFDLSYTAYGNGAKEALAFIRADGSDFRLLAHHYSTFSGNLPADPFRYWSMPKGSLSPDGKIVVFDSNMLAAAPARYDLFAVEVPTQ